MTSDQVSQAGTELGQACFTQLPQLMGDITKQLCYVTTMSKPGKLIYLGCVGWKGKVRKSFIKVIKWWVGKSPKLRKRFWLKQQKK